MYDLYIMIGLFQKEIYIPIIEIQRGGETKHFILF